MEIEHFANSSIRSYLNSIKQLSLYTGKLPNQLQEEDIYEFLFYLVNEKGYSRETVRNYLQGIRYVYKRVYKRNDVIDDIPYSKKTKKLPVILTGKELIKLFNSTKSLKQKLVLQIAYGGALRKNEISKLKLTDIDTKNYLLRIENSKGNKDRYTLLSKSLVPEIRRYYLQEKPLKYLFNGRDKGSAYSDQVLQWTFQEALKKSGIQKKVSLVNLRHSFASHLLAMGTDLVTIQKLMGHEDIRTTMVYIQVNHQISQKPVISPIDLLIK